MSDDILDIEEDELPDPGTLPPNNFGLIFYVTDYWLTSHHQHYVSAVSYNMAELMRDGNYVGAKLTQYKGALKVSYLAFDELDKPYIAHMYWNLYQVETNEDPAFTFFIWGEDEDHVRMQLAKIHTAVIEDRNPI